MPQISIIIPQYKTLDITKLCLRALRKFSTSDIEVIVVDNDSKDNSLEYLRSLKWIRLIENADANIGGIGHKQALDLGISAATGKWILLFHSDSIVLKNGWDNDLISLVQSCPEAVGATTVIREMNKFAPWYKRLYRACKDTQWSCTYSLDATNEKIMSYCFLIDRQFLINSRFKFSESKGDVADALYRQEIKGIKSFLLLGRSFLESRIWHTSNISSILTGQITDPSLIRKLNKKLKKLSSNKVILDLMNDSSLDA